MAGILSILSINLIFAYGIYLSVASGQLNLGGAGFQAIGAYAAGWLSASFDAPLVVTIVAGSVVGGAVWRRAGLSDPQDQGRLSGACHLRLCRGGRRRHPQFR